MTTRTQVRLMAFALASLGIFLGFGLDADFVGGFVQFFLGGIGLALMALVILAILFGDKRLARGQAMIVRYEAVNRSKIHQLMVRSGLVFMAIWAFTHLIGVVLVTPSLRASNKSQLSNGLVYGTTMAMGCKIHYLEVDLKLIRPVILTASNMSSGKVPLVTMAARQRNVLAAVNGDYFDEGGPSGFLVVNGRKTAPRRDRATLSLDHDGRKAAVEIYRFATTAHVKASGVPYPIRQTLNNAWLPGDVGIYTHARGVASGEGRGPILQARVKLTLGNEGSLRMVGYVTQVVDKPKTNLLPREGEIIVVAGNEPGVPLSMGAYYWGKTYLGLDSPVHVYLSISPKPTPMVLSGGPELVRMGQYFVQEAGNESLFPRNARTAVGITHDQQHLLVVVVEGPPKWAVDHPKVRFKQLTKLQFRAFFGGLVADGSNFGRALWLWFWVDVMGLGQLSRGMTLREAATYMGQQNIDGQAIESAINLDGGSSTCMTMRGALASKTTECEPVALATGLGFEPR